LPSSRPHAIPYVISLLRQIDPGSILDIGVGFGKWGTLFREYTDIRESEKDPGRYQRENWQVRIDGIEGYENYISPHHRFIYDNIYIGDAIEILPGLDSYDFIFIGDVIEHFTMEDGTGLIEEALRHCNGYLALTTPRFETDQGDLCANQLEAHKSLWTADDLKRPGDAQVFTIPGEVLLAVYASAGKELIEPRVKGPVTRMELAKNRALNQLRETRLFKLMRSVVRS